ncbi:hypothetical protein GPECTOR_5g271 [Gonium pectorale]|uniref:Uncharacterized protein n=1 Tax=Gonium pectorale TaxID=33097 RepID=A0A150GWK5_GONPE|nr:hypothetical protein GPECTOR_5g271 [Gonium pectorale]|eukprot:KXZ54175.1 hypothetical protein GPECTOR_5g271 [Gonium pectorale]
MRPPKELTELSPAQLLLRQPASVQQLRPPQPLPPHSGSLGKVQGELTLLYQWYVANKTAYLDQAQRQLRRVETLAGLPAAGAGAKAESADAMRAFETALHIMQVCGTVEQQCLAQQQQQQQQPTAAATVSRADGLKA